ncbi:uncharacterized protein LOC112195094 [Rosa chinensis]|uniref:uncharacterized protein LOC112195094 n=1 Tax=Rosa chinensis TaxID=74649 RepID=UPI000D09622E|nr:uncharacterized protein LOC112195094 [Rosa chinensis]
MSPGSGTTGRTCMLWRVRLCSAFRTILACTVIYLTTLYAPETLKQLVAHPAYSYLTTILIVSADATLGDALKGFWHALYACVQVLSLSILSLQLIGPALFTSHVIAALAVAVTTFIVALPEVTSLMCKRIAFGQIVIVYVGTAIHGNTAQADHDQDDTVLMHPIQVASSTMLGALASVLAMLFPNLVFYHEDSFLAMLSPHLGYHQVGQMCRKYTDNARKRLSLYLEAVVSQDSLVALDTISEAQHLTIVGEKLLHSIKQKQEALVWERPDIRILKPSCTDLEKKLQDIDVPLRGMEVALTCCPSFPVAMIDKVPKDAFTNIKSHIIHKLEQLERISPFYMTKKNGNSLDWSFWTLENLCHEDFLAFFFLDCLKLLQENTEAIEECKKDTEIKSFSGSQNQSNSSIIRCRSTLEHMIPSKASLLLAFKCSLSLCLAVLFGLIYNEKEAYWAGLTIAISFVTGRQATFTVTNARAQSTAMGSIYGILCCFVFQKFEDISFLPLIPWLIFTSFLRHSRMYGQAGGISAAVGALLILGRKNYGPPIDFAIARITEAVIGLICFVTIEILSCQVRAAPLVKLELSHCLGALQECIKDIVLCDNNQSNLQASIFPALKQKQDNLKSHLNQFEKFVVEAELEPNFWFIPFNSACYRKLLRSVLKMTDLSLFMSNKVQSLSLALKRFEVAAEDLQSHIKGMKNDIDLFKNIVCSSLQCLQELSSKKSLAVRDKHDMQLGALHEEDDECSILSSFLQHSNYVSDGIDTGEGKKDEKLKSQVILCLGGLGFCITSLLREVQETEKEFQELAKWENPSNHVVV